MGVAKAPLVLEERLQMLREGWWKPLELKPFCVSRLKCKEVTRLAGIVGAVHVGAEKDVEVWWEMELVECENLDRGGGCEGGRRRKVGLLDLVAIAEFLPCAVVVELGSKGLVGCFP